MRFRDAERNKLANISQTHFRVRNNWAIQNESLSTLGFIDIGYVKHDTL